MICESLCDLLNSGDAVAIVGSGVSAEAGVPLWSELFYRVADALDSENHDTSAARDAATKNKLPTAFNLLAVLTSPQDVHNRTSALIEQVTTPGEHHTRLADWPFRFQITTNYDHLIEKASSGHLVAVGNRGAELHKISGGVGHVVWHIHGGTKLSRDTSLLVVTQADYDEFYPNSNVVEKLKAITTAHRCVFIGFGFNDEDFVHVLRAVGRLSHSGRPSYAFLAYDDPSSQATEHQEEIRSTYNVEVIPYYTHGRGHSELNHLLDGYAPFVLRRSISLGRTPSGTPGYEPCASSLKVQSSLDLGELSATNAGLRHTLVGARVVAHIREYPGGGEDDLATIYRSGDPSKVLVLESLQALRKRGIVTPSPTLNLTAAYQTKTQEAQAQLELARDRFHGSLGKRATEVRIVLDEAARNRAVAVVSNFLEDLSRQRGLGVAQNLATSDTEHASRRAVSLVQQLPQHLTRCETRDEALAAIQITTELLSRPTEAEAAYLGLLCQCYFGQHLVGASDRLAKVDLDLITGTCYLLDASVLVCLLAEGSEGHEFTLSLVRDLSKCGATLATTDLFTDEIAEHADWALRLVVKHGEQSNEVIAALRCVRGYRPNQFLRGYFFGPTSDSSFRSYMGRVLAIHKGDRVTGDVAKERLAALGIQALAFNEWSGFDDALILRRQQVQDEIDARRLEIGTYRHERQTRAEAEVALLVDGIRRQELQPPGSKAQDAFFLSSTRVVDRLPNLERRISLRPEGLAQWLWSSQATSSRHAELVFEQLLWDLAQGGIEFVDRTTLLRRFSGVVEASKAELKSAIKDRREYLVDKYGHDPSAAFADADPLDMPRLATEVQREALVRMEHALAAANIREQEARSAAKIGDKERRELDTLRMKQQERQRKAERKRRAAESKKGKKRGRGRKRS